MYIIMLKLISPYNTLDHVRRIPGLEKLNVDESYGVVSVSSKRGLYVIRVSGELDIDRIRAIPEVAGVYGDVRIAPFNEEKNNLED